MTEQNKSKEHFQRITNDWIDPDWFKSKEDYDQFITSATSELSRLKEENERLNKKISAYESDIKEAAGELAVSIPEPGTEAAKMLHANIMMRKYRIPELQEKLSAKEKECEEKFTLDEIIEAFNEWGWSDGGPDTFITNLKAKKEGGYERQSASPEIRI